MAEPPPAVLLRQSDCGPLLMSRRLTQGGISALCSAWLPSRNMKTDASMCAHTHACTHSHSREPGVCFSQMWAMSRTRHIHVHTEAFSQFFHLVIYHSCVCSNALSHTHKHCSHRSWTYVCCFTTGERCEAGGRQCLWDATIYMTKQDWLRDLLLKLVVP